MLSGWCFCGETGCKYAQRNAKTAGNIDERHLKCQIILQSKSFLKSFHIFVEQALLSHPYIRWGPLPRGRRLHFAPPAIKLHRRNAFCIKICFGWRRDSVQGYELALLRNPNVKYLARYSASNFMNWASLLTIFPRYYAHFHLPELISLTPLII